MPIKLSAALICFCLLAGTAFSQETNTWLFGNHVYGDFSNGLLEIDTNRRSGYFVESGTCISDEHGDLLFYVTGDSIFNRFFRPILGTRLDRSDESTTQGVLILPAPGKDSLYYVIYRDYTPESPNTTISYHFVDPYSGIGKVVGSSKSIWAPNNVHASEKLQAIKHANGSDWWLIYHNDRFRDYYVSLVTGDSIYPSRRIPIGSYFNHWSDTAGELIASPDGDQLLCVAYSGKINLFDFDRCTGEISNFIDLADSGAGINYIQYIYGGSFSPDGSKLYVSEAWEDSVNTLFQWDVNAADVRASKTIIGTFDTIYYIVGQHELGPDGRIYIAGYKDNQPNHPGSLNISVINFPDSAGAKCGFSLLSINLKGRRSTYHLPNHPNYKLGPLLLQTANTGPPVDLCKGDTTRIGVPDSTGGLVLYSWQPATGLSNPDQASTLAFPDTTTWYVLTAVDTTFPATCNTTVDSVLIRVFDPATTIPVAEAGNGDTLCPGESIQIGPLTPGIPGFSYQWSPGTGLDSANKLRPIAQPDSSTWYYLTVTNTAVPPGCNAATDSVRINVLPALSLPIANAGPDSLLCFGESIQIGQPDPSAGRWSYSWSPTQFLSDPNLPQTRSTPEDSIQYLLTVTNPNLNPRFQCRTASDTISLSVSPRIQHPITPDEVLFCEGEVLTIGPEPQNTFQYSWTPTSGLKNPFAAQNSIRPVASTTYTLSISDPNIPNRCGKRSETVSLNLQPCILPNVITPNGDGINDVLSFDGFNGPIAVQIFDRWGNRIFSADPYSNNFNGQDLPASVYFYTLKTEQIPNGKKSGSFLLIR